MSYDQHQGQYVPPPATMPDDYWRAAAEAKTARNSYYGSTIGAWVVVLIGLFIWIFALAGALWSLWLSRDDSRYLAPAAVGFGIVLLPFLL